MRLRVFVFCNKINRLELKNATLTIVIFIVKIKDVNYTLGWRNDLGFCVI